MSISNKKTYVYYIHSQKAHNVYSVYKTVLKNLYCRQSYAKMASRLRAFGQT